MRLLSKLCSLPWIFDRPKAIEGVQSNFDGNHGLVKLSYGMYVMHC